MVNKKLPSVSEQILGLAKDILNFTVPDPASTTQVPRNCVLDIDASGSMLDQDWQPTRLEGAQQAAKAFIKRLRFEEPEAKVAIVAYSDDADLICDLSPVTNYRELERNIDSIYTMGATNITAGLEMTYDLIKNIRSLAQVVVLSDGYHNTGAEPKSISDKLRKSAIIECVGIGGSPIDVDEELLKYIASSYPDGKKRYRWIGDKERLVKHFHNLAGRIVRA